MGGIGDEDDERALRRPREPNGVRLDLDVGVRGEQAPDEIAEPLGARAVDEDEDALLDEPEDAAQPDEPGLPIRSRCIVRSGCG